MKSIFKKPPTITSNPHLEFDTYESRAPSAQNCIDAIPGWNSKFPDEYHVVAGDRIGFGDERLAWGIERFGPLAGAEVLELGPLEGAQTYVLHQHGASITAVEANKQAFLKCLVTKEIVGLPRAKFLLGDCVQYLEQTEQRYDLIVASGVLYHMRDPLRFLSAVAARTDAVYLWTIHIDERFVPPGSDLETALAQLREDHEFHGVTTTMYKFNYANAHLNPDFCGGIYNEPRWMNRASILAALDALGFSSVEIAHETRSLPHAPCFSIFARRPT